MLRTVKTKRTRANRRKREWTLLKLHWYCAFVLSRYRGQDRWRRGFLGRKRKHRVTTTIMRAFFTPRRRRDNDNNGCTQNAVSWKPLFFLLPFSGDVFSGRREGTKTAWRGSYRLVRFRSTLSVFDVNPSDACVRCDRNQKQTSTYVIRDLSDLDGVCVRRGIGRARRTIRKTNRFVLVDVIVYARNKFPLSRSPLCKW